VIQDEGKGQKNEQIRARGNQVEAQARGGGAGGGRAQPRANNSARLKGRGLQGTRQARQKMPDHPSPIREGENYRERTKKEKGGSAVHHIPRKRKVGMKSRGEEREGRAKSKKATAIARGRCQPKRLHREEVFGSI